MMTNRYLLMTSPFQFEDQDIEMRNCRIINVTIDQHLIFIPNKRGRGRSTDHEKVGLSKKQHDNEETNMQI